MSERPSQQPTSGLAVAAPASPAADCSPPRCRAWRSPKSWAVLLLVLIFGLALDIGTKYWSFANVAPHPVHLDRDEILDGHNPTANLPGKEVLPAGLLDFRLVLNEGAVFGIGGGKRVFFIGFTVVALAAGLIIFARFTNNRSTLAHAGIGLILAGGLGNLYDRIVYGVVRDFLHMFPGWHLPFGWTWPRWFGGSPEIFPWVFNVADVMLLAGMAALMIHIHRVENQRKRKEEEAAAHNRVTGQPDTPRA